MNTTRIRQLIATTALAALPLFSGVAVTHSLDHSINEVRGLAPDRVDPPGVALGAQLAAETGD
ncbi:hypothetical protein NYP18_13980 [Corynebacterium sp. YIM 101645]|uniref:Secreted protein n=1 Tax=Corynebacterium lemuris TaxID=1859292 RepID=A0ABT2FZS1_9CORY|nr:hypothetical protein [Corynebacterium lemuris]MCS5480750.1 hypothetical protein [Corynebacterium lemuris]